MKADHVTSSLSLPCDTLADMVLMMEIPKILELSRVTISTE